MKKREWLLVLFPIFATIALDQITKLWILRTPELKTFGPLGMALHLNPGAMLGIFSDLPPILRIVSLSTGGTFLLFTYIIIQYLLPIRSLLLRAGMSTLMGGILGNVADRTFYGHVVDFIFFSFGNWHSPVFNLADALQWVGYACVVTALIRDGELLWPENNVRKYYWINAKFQIKYCFTLLLIGLGFSLIAGTFSYTFIRFMMLDIVGNNQKLMNQFLIPFIETFAAFTVAYAAFLFLIGKILSHRVAGPVYAFERFIKNHIRGHQAPLRLRKGDEFLHLEELSQFIIHNLEPKRENNEPVPILPIGQANHSLKKTHTTQLQNVG